MNFGKKTFLFLAVNAVSSSVPLLLVPLLTSRLDPSEYGMIALWLVIHMIVSVLITGGLDGIVQARIFSANKYMDNHLAQVIIVICIYASLVYIIVDVFYTDSIFKLIGLPSHTWPLLVFASTCLAINSILLSMWVIQEKLRQYVASIVVGTLLNLSSSFLFIYLDFGWEGRIYGIIVGLIGTLSTAALFICKNFSGTIKLSRFCYKEVIPGSQYYLLHSLAGIGLASSDRLILSNISTQEDLGLYALGLQFAGLFGFIQDGIGKSWQSWIKKELPMGKNENLRVVGQRIIGISLLLIIGSLALGSLMVFALPLLVAPRYESAGGIIYILSLGYALNGVYKLFVPFIFIANKSTSLARNTVICLVANLIIGYGLGYQYGAIGVAWGFVISMGLMAALGYMETVLSGFMVFKGGWK